MCFHCEAGNKHNHIPTEYRKVFDPGVYRCQGCGGTITKEQADGASPHWCGGRYIFISQEEPDSLPPFELGQVVFITTLAVYDLITCKEYYRAGKQWLYCLKRNSGSFSETVLRKLTPEEIGIAAPEQKKFSGCKPHRWRPGANDDQA